MKLQKIVAMLPVSDVNRSIDFFVTTLGFHVVNEDLQRGWAFLERDGCELMLDQSIKSSQGNSDAVLYLNTDDVEECWRQVKAKGINADPPEITLYGMHEFRLFDPDMNQVWIGQQATTVSHGSASTVYVSEEVANVIQLHQDLFTDEFRTLSIREQLARQAQRIFEAHKAGNTTVVTHIQCWHPELVGHSAEEILSYHLALDDARQSIAREYGFDSWEDAEQRGNNPPNPYFELAVDALLAGEIATLEQLLNEKPSLVHERSEFGHRSTLLHYVGSNGVETYRQVVPRNLAEIALLLLDAGADVNATAEMYGGGSTTIALLITSSHPAEAGVVDEVVKILVDAGAETE